MPADPKLPEKVGRYEVLGFLAAGGMAEVLLGRFAGPSGFERPVVIKRILPHLLRQQAFVDMFLDEARIVAGIRHPNVVSVTELGTDDGELFLVMEYLEGESVWGLMRRLAANEAFLDPSLAAYIIAEAAAGLHAAHELTDVDGHSRGLVHRDVSPQNIFVTYGGAVKMLDFGIAKAGDRLTQTEMGQVKGKLEYMAPEQVKSKPIDRRTDVFALGVVFFELLTGRRLFKRDSPAAAVRAICDEPIPLPSGVRVGVPAALDAIVKRALAQEPNERYASAAEMRRDILRELRSMNEAPDEALSALLSEVFADRISAKAEMLRRVHSGSSVTPVPASESQELAEVPNISQVTLGPTHVPALRRAPRQAWAIVAVLLLVIGVGAAWSVRSARLVSSATQTSLTATTPASADRPASSSVTVLVDSTPSGAAVDIGGQPRGVTPLTVTLARSQTMLEAEITLDGYEPLDQALVPTADQHLVVTLQRRVASAPASTPTYTNAAGHPRVRTHASSSPQPTTTFTPQPW